MKTTLIAFWSILYLAWSISSLIEIYKEMIINKEHLASLRVTTLVWIIINATALIVYSVQVIIIEN